MRKRQIWVLGLLVGQAVSILVKEKKLREDIVATPWILGKLEKFGKKWWETNKKLFQDAKGVDRDSAAASLKDDVQYDTEKVKEWVHNQTTTGKENMSKLDKIIYLADMIEPSRDFSGVEELRNDSKDDLDKAMLNALNHTIKYLLEKGCLIDINTVKARNYLLYNNYK